MVAVIPGYCDGKLYQAVAMVTVIEAVAMVAVITVTAGCHHDDYLRGNRHVRGLGFSLNHGHEFVTCVPETIL